MKKNCGAVNTNSYEPTGLKKGFQQKIIKKLVISKADFDFPCCESSTSNLDYFMLENWKENNDKFEKFMDHSDLNQSQVGKVLWKNTKNESSKISAMPTLTPKNNSCLKPKNLQNADDKKQVFWKTSKFYFPLSMTERSNNQSQNQNMLWRSLQHLQRFCEEKCINMQQISEVFNVEFQKIAQNNSLQLVSDRFLHKNKENEPGGRKARLSKWTFLGHKKKYLRMSVDQIEFSSKFPIQKRNFLKNTLEFKTFRGDIQCEINAGSNKCLSSDEYCNCSCKECAEDVNKNMSVEVTEQLRKTKMAPNSEEDPKMVFSNKRHWATELADKEPLRPPVYNPEDYASSLKKWGKKGSLGIQLPQYLSQSTGSLEKFSEELSHRNKRQSSSPSTKSSSSIKSGDEKQSKKEKETTLKIEKKDLKNKENISKGLKSDMQKNFLNPIISLSSQTPEMSLRQFSSVTELLGKLKVDLKLSFLSFVQEFVGDPIDGVTLLLELLRSVQLSQTSQLQKCPPQILRRALLDEHSCLICLKYCLRCSDASRRLASSPAGLFTLAVCIMSNVTQSRILALELLTKACEPQAGGHKAVSEALSTLRLRFGEPVRFRFLVGMLSSAGAVDLLTTAMSFINVFVDSAPNLQQKVYIQAELEQAGFDSEILRKSLPSNSERVKMELNKWEKNYFDVEKLCIKVAEANALQEKIHLLEKRIQILQEEKGILQSLEQCLKERCSELEEVSVNTNTSAKVSPTKPFRNCDLQQNRRNADKGESTPAEDEGISSSEQELSQDEDYIKGEIPYICPNDLKKIKNLNKNNTPKQSEGEFNRYLNKSSNDSISGSCKLKNFRNISSNKLKETNVDDGNEIIPTHGEDEEEEEETTIDEVIEELENIVNDAETEAYANEEKVNILGVGSSVSFTENSQKMTSGEKCQTYSNSSFILQEKNNFEESEIIPAILHPQPPKKSKSLVHIYFAGSDFDSQDRNKSEFFEDDTDSESSDSLLTNTREKKTLHKGSHNSLQVSESFNSFSSINTRSFFITQEQELENCDLNPGLNYEERNIDEEETKRKWLKQISAGKKENIQTEFSEMFFKTKSSQSPQNNEMRKEFKENSNGFPNMYERNTLFQSAKNNFVYRVSNEGPLSRAPKFAPAPVKRSQTFHISTSDGENLYKKNEVKPKPKMGVSGLDCQRASEHKLKNENWNYNIFDYKKRLERRMDETDKYSKIISKSSQNIQDNEKFSANKSLRRENSNESFTAIQANVRSNVRESFCRSDSFSALDKSFLAPRSKSIEKIDEGLDSLVDIVISTDESKKPKPKNEWSAEVTKNIGPRTRRSLADSSLFCPQYAKNPSKSEEIPKAPKPAQRTSLSKNNSSSTPPHAPVEVKLAPNQMKQQQQIIYNFDMKLSKSTESLLASCQEKRCPPDGSSSPIGFKKNQENVQKFTPEKPRPVKQAKIQPFFGNSKLENSVQSGEVRVNLKRYFETNYSPKLVAGEKLNDKNDQTQQGSREKLKNQVLNFNQPKVTGNGNKGVEGKDNQMHSKPNFLLGTYQSPISTSNITKPKISGLVLQSINTFNNNSFVNNVYSNGKKTCSQPNNFSSKEKCIKIIRNRQGNSITSGSEKVTDSPSGLY